MSGAINRDCIRWKQNKLARTAEINASNSECISRNYTAGKVVLRILATLVLSGGCALGAYYGFKLYAGSTSLSGVFIQLGAAQGALTALATVGLIWFPYGYEFKSQLKEGYLKLISDRLRNVQSYEELQELCYTRNWKRDFELRNDAKNWVKNGVMTEQLKDAITLNLDCFIKIKAKEKAWDSSPNQRNNKMAQELNDLRSQLIGFSDLKEWIQREVSPPTAYVEPKIPPQIHKNKKED